MKLSFSFISFYIAILGNQTRVKNPELKAQLPPSFAIIFPATKNKNNFEVQEASNATHLVYIQIGMRKGSGMKVIWIWERELQEQKDERLEWRVAKCIGGCGGGGE